MTYKIERESYVFYDDRDEADYDPKDNCGFVVRYSIGVPGVRSSEHCINIEMVDVHSPSIFMNRQSALELVDALMDVINFAETRERDIACGTVTILEQPKNPS